MLRARDVVVGLALVGACLPARVASAQQPAESVGAGSVRDRVLGLDRVARRALDEGRHDEALRAVEEAYRLTNDPKYLYNIGFIADQAFWISDKEVHVVKAVDALRTYLKEAQQGKKRSEATQMLKRLEPLLPKAPEVDPEAPPQAPAPPAPPPPARTGVMISSSTPGAVIELDGKLRANGLLVADVEAGPHRVRIIAEGHVPVERSVLVQPGALVGVDVPLEPKPALLEVKGPSGARLSVDGELRGELPLAKPLSLPPGDRLITVQRAGSRTMSEWRSLERGSTYSFQADLETTTQRHTAWGMFIVGGVAAVPAAVLTGMSFKRESDAADLIDPVNEGRGGITSGQLALFDEAIDDRDLYRTGAGIAWGIAGASLATGVFLYVFDEPVEQAPTPAPGKSGPSPTPEEPGAVELSVVPQLDPSFAGVHLGGRF